MALVGKPRARGRRIDPPVLAGEERGSLPVLAGADVTPTSRPDVPGLDVRGRAAPPVVAGWDLSGAGAEVSCSRTGNSNQVPGEADQVPQVTSVPLPSENNPAEYDDNVDDFLKMLNVPMLRTHRFSSLCKRVGTFETTVLQLGVTLLQLQLVSPRDGLNLSTWISQQLKLTSTSPTRVRDILPLPLPPVGAAKKLLQTAQSADDGMLKVAEPATPGEKRRGRQQRKQLLTEGTKQVWRCLTVIVLNGMTTNWVYEGPLQRRLTELQKAAMENVNRWVGRFCADPLYVHALSNFSALVQSKSIDYSGEEVSHALPLRLDELLPGLPLRGVAGSLSAVSAATGEVQAWVEDPRLTLKPPESWPKAIPRARINATKAEWYKVCEVLYDRGIIEAIDEADIFKVNGFPVLNGAFAVEKKGKAGAGQSRVTRLIMNFVPSNSFQRLMPGDLSTLATSTSWTQLLLKPNQVLLWSGDDQKGAFYAWELPRQWRPYMAFCWPVPGHLVGSSRAWEFVASRVIPMGWIQAVSLFQHLHRNLGMNAPPAGAGHDEALEWRRDRPAPQGSEGDTSEFVQFYLDDFDCPEMIPSDGWEDLEGTMGPTHCKQRKSYQRWGVGISEDKAHLRQPKVIRMGAEVDGIQGTIGIPLSKKLDAAFFAIWCMGLEKPPTKILLMVLGRLVRCFEFRRPLMSLLATVWPKGDPTIRRPIGAGGRQELLRAISMLAMASADLRSPISGLVTCSDASETGGGICCSGSLSGEGLRVLESLQTPLYKKTRCAVFAPQGALTVSNDQGPRVMVVSLFDGIGAVMCGLSRLRCRIVAYASSEIDKPCRRLVRKRWPGVIELGDVTKITDEALETLWRSVCFQVDLVLAGGGSPCQDLSVLLADRKGLEGSRSKLFFDMPRIFKALKSICSCPVFTFVENVFSMSKDNRDQFTVELGHEPVLLDCTSFTKCRRPRLFWVDWPIKPRNQEKMVQHDSYREWRFPDLCENKDWWLDPLCSHRSTRPLPTFTRALPRKGPPKQPAGMANASREAVARWRADHYRFQVYQYEACHLVQRPDGQLRVPSVMEREKLMGFPAGYVSAGVSTKITVAEAFNLGACMIGNSFNVYCISFLLDELLAHCDKTYVPRQLDRILSRGEVAPVAWCDKPLFDSTTQPDAHACMLVQEFMRQGDRGGTDVKLDLGIPFRARAWPRTGIRSRLFHWKIINGFTWRHTSHINVLELQATVHALQWRLRKVTRFRHRVLHLVDNQVVASVISKGRSSSYRLRRAIQKLSALLLAGEIRLSIGYVASEDNPSDIPSRWSERRSTSKNSCARPAKPSGRGSLLKKKF